MAFILLKLWIWLSKEAASGSASSQGRESGMHDDNARTSDFVVEIRDAVGPIGNAGGKGIRPVVSIIDDGVAGTRGEGSLSLLPPF